MKGWFLMFGDTFFKEDSELEKEEILNETQFELEKAHLVKDRWYADYKRIRVVAVKESVS